MSEPYTIVVFVYAETQLAVKVGYSGLADHGVWLPKHHCSFESLSGGRKRLTATKQLLVDHGLL